MLEVNDIVSWVTVNEDGVIIHDKNTEKVYASGEFPTDLKIGFKTLNDALQSEMDLNKDSNERKLLTCYNRIITEEGTIIEYGLGKVSAVWRAWNDKRICYSRTIVITYYDGIETMILRMECADEYDNFNEFLKLKNNYSLETMYRKILEDGVWNYETKHRK